jgi:hypothetical protein
MFPAATDEFPEFSVIRARQSIFLTFFRGHATVAAADTCAAERTLVRWTPRS